MSITDDLKRLERAGQENSTYTQKLKDATARIAGEIIKNIEDGFDCPDDGFKRYRLTKKNNLPHAHDDDIYLVIHSNGNCYIGYNDDIEKSCELNGFGWPESASFSLENPTRKRAFRFAEDIASGLLNRITICLESRKKNNEEALKKLNV
jgi:hypothetical protein